MKKEINKTALWIILGIVGLMIVSRGRVGGLLRFILPALVLYGVYRLVKKYVIDDGGSEARPKVDDSAHARGPSNPNVIQICPDCGRERQAKHRCS